MASATYKTSKEEVLDAVVWNHYGRTQGIVEQVLEANRGLADYGPFIPAGVLIILPDIESANEPASYINLPGYDV